MTSSDNVDFLGHSENVVRDFLQTVVVVDDRAYFEPTESSVKPTATLRSPVRPSFSEIPEAEVEETEILEAKTDTPAVSSAEDAEGLDSEIQQARTPAETSEDVAHELNAKRLTEQFADSGIMCAVLRPIEVELNDLDNRVYALADRADVIVFDWVLFKDTEGKKVSQLIAEITKKASQKNRLKLILIYTGEKTFKAIIDSVAKVLEQGGLQNVIRKDDFTIEIGGTRITIYGKGNVDPGDDVLRARMSPVDQLPGTIVSEFTKMTSGLVSNVALSSLAALRSNTHTILSRFAPDMDAPFLSHRAMLPQPEDSTALLVQLVGGELTAVLDGHGVGATADSFAGLDVIKAWIDNKQNEGYEFRKRFNAGQQEDVLDQVSMLLRKGVRDGTLHAPFNSFKNEPHKKHLTQKLAVKDANEEELEHRFAVLTTLKSDYRVPTNQPLLLPGSLLKEIKEPDQISFLLCIQPICDCLRIDQKRAFPFLPLRPPTEEDPAFDLVLPDGGAYIHLRIQYSPYALKMIDFDPSEGVRAIQGEVNEGLVQFKASSGTLYRWIGELKFDQTQGIVNNYAGQVFRVGVDESEWLRRWAKR